MRLVGGWVGGYGCGWVDLGDGGRLGLVAVVVGVGRWMRDNTLKWKGIEEAG